MVLDVRMPPAFVDEGIQAALAIHRRWPAVGVLVLSQYVERRNAAQLITAKTAGVGYLLKDRVIEKHINSIFGKLDLMAEGGYGRRVLAILTYLRS